MLEEEQIAFRSDSPTFDGIEDYSHQIAEMIGLRNESSFIHIGVGGHLLFVRIYTLNMFFCSIILVVHLHHLVSVHIISSISL